MWTHRRSIVRSLTLKLPLPPSRRSVQRVARRHSTAYAFSLRAISELYPGHLSATLLTWATSSVLSFLLPRASCLSAWQVIGGLQKLHKHEIEAYINEPSKKNGDLLEGYRIALDPSEWDNTRAETLRKYMEDQKNAPIDELDEEEDEEKVGKKRKRDSEGMDKKKFSKKTTPAKVGVRTKSDSAGTRPKKRGKKNGITSSEMIPESEDEGAEKKDVERPAKRAKGEEDDEDEECEFSAIDCHRCSSSFGSHVGRGEDG